MVRRHWNWHGCENDTGRIGVLYDKDPPAWRAARRVRFGRAVRGKPSAAAGVGGVPEAAAVGRGIPHDCRQPGAVHAMRREASPGPHASALIPDPYRFRNVRTVPPCALLVAPLIAVPSSDSVPLKLHSCVFGNVQAIVRAAFILKLRNARLTGRSCGSVVRISLPTIVPSGFGVNSISMS